MKIADLKKKVERAGTKNPVAKNMGINRAATHKDRKKARNNPRKNQKHKKPLHESIGILFEEKRTWTKDEIREKINSDTRWLLRAVSAIYQKQTEDEQSGRITSHVNNVGFNGVDAEFLSQAAERYNSGWNFSEKYINAIRRAMLKYSGQLTKIANNEI